MKIDPKYFNLFVGTVAVAAAFSIFYFTIRYADNQRESFKQSVADLSDIKSNWFVHVSGDDSVRVSDFGGKVVILDFWSTWSKPAMESHRVLREIQERFPDRIQVIAASVRDLPENVNEYEEAENYGFYYAEGTRFFQNLRTPGVPSQVIFGPNGELMTVRVGYKSPDDYLALITFLNENQP